MSNTIKLSNLVLSQSSFILTSSRSAALPSITARKRVTTTVRFVQMDAKDDSLKNSPDKTRNLMKESFGEGYATRSDDEGFGGIYGDNDECDKVNHDPSQMDTKQGAEVKEKEKARNQEKVDQKTNSQS